jgi:hypothetical protein
MEGLAQILSIWPPNSSKANSSTTFHDLDLADAYTVKFTGKVR